MCPECESIRANGRNPAGRLSVGTALLQHTLAFCSFLGYSQRLQIGYKLRVEANNSSSSLNPKALTFLHILMMHFLFLGRVQISCIIIILRPSPILKSLAFKYIITLSPGPSICYSVLQKWGVFFFPSPSLKTKSVQIVTILPHCVRRIQSSMYAGFTKGPTNW